MLSFSGDTRILITGAAGFVGQHVLRILSALPNPPVVLPTARDSALLPEFGPVAQLDILNDSQVRQTLLDFAPTHILHLAGIAAPAQANKDRSVTWAINVEATLGLAQAVQDLAPNCWLLNVGSGLSYGGAANMDDPLTEHSPLDPWDHYGLTKAVADMALGTMTRQGLKNLRFRPFNHTGRDQTNDFVVPAFASQLVAIEKGLQEPVLKVGNLDAWRDFLDVRDVAMAYLLAITKTDTLAPGSVFNIAMGSAQRIGDVLDRLIALSNVSVSIEQDPSRMRPSDIARVVGSNARARAALDWQPHFALDETLLDVLQGLRAS